MTSACVHSEIALSKLFSARDYITGHSFAIYRCDRCGLALTRPVPLAMSDYYPAGYYRPAGSRRFPAVVELLQRGLYAARARTVEKLVGGPGRVLDIGCGPGLLLQAFRARGWQVQGTELTEGSAAHARALGIAVQLGAPESWPWAEGSFDSVVMWHVLEHWADPEQAALQARRLLRPGGVLLVGVPNFGSAEARGAREGWFHLDVPRHLAHFNEEALRHTLETAGLRVRKLSFLAPEFDAFSCVQSVENRLGLRPNLLYNLLRGRSARVTGEPGLLQAVAALLLAVPLTIFALPATLLLGVLGRGSSMTALAVRG